jgi:hypothetical protein
MLKREENLGDIEDMKREFNIKPMRFEDAIRTYLK